MSLSKQVIYRDRQEFQSADPNNAQAYVASSLEHIITDAISDGSHYAGLLVTQASPTTVDVGIGRLYVSGVKYVHEASENKDLFSYLPITQKRIVTVCAWGSAVETNVEARDFLIDLENSTTEPQAVAMTGIKQAVIDLVSGAESADPQAPNVGTALAVANVTLGTTGVESIEMLVSNELPQSRDLDSRLGVVETWKVGAEPRIQSIATDLAALAERTSELADHASFVNLASDIASLREALQIPDTNTGWGADRFEDATESDPLGVGYSAVVGNGLRFGHAGESTAPVALLNPSDPSVYRDADGLVLPAFTHEQILRTTGYAGSISINAYPAWAWSWYPYVHTLWSYHYGWSWNWYRPWWNSWYWSYYGPTYHYYLGSRYWLNRILGAYQPGVTPESDTGAMIAQTFLQPNSRWETRVGIYLTTVDAGAGLQLLITETNAGKPDLTRVLSRTTVVAGDLEVYPVETLVDVQPAYLEGGKRYALVLISQGAHRLAVVSGSTYTQGTLFYGTDGDYLQGDLTKDLMFTLYGAKFSHPRIEIPLESVSLAGGLTDIDLAADQVVPDGTDLSYEIQVNGVWRRLAEDADLLSGGTHNLVPLRAVFVGTQDLASAVWLNASGLKASRPADTFTHWSSERTLTAASDNIEVHVLVSAWSGTDHALTITLETATTTYTATGVVQSDEAGARRFVATFAPEVGTGISAYQIKIVGTRAAGTVPFVVTERTDIAL